MINPKNSHKDLKGALKINITIIQKYIKIFSIKIRNEMYKFTTWDNQGILNNLEKIS